MGSTAAVITLDDTTEVAYIRMDFMRETGGPMGEPKRGVIGRFSLDQ